jgi:hypothetical protein
MFTDFITPETIAIDLHGVITNNPKFFDALLNMLRCADKKIHIVSGPPRLQIEKEINSLGLYSHYHYNDIHSVVDYLRLSEGVKMWQDEKKHWWTNDHDWWQSKGKICRVINADVILDDKLEYKIGFPKDHPTKFIHYSKNWEKGLRLCMMND